MKKTPEIWRCTKGRISVCRVQGEPLGQPLPKCEASSSYLSLAWKRASQELLYLKMCLKTSYREVKLWPECWRHPGILDVLKPSLGCTFLLTPLTARWRSAPKPPDPSLHLCWGIFNPIILFLAGQVLLRNRLNTGGSHGNCTRETHPGWHISISKPNSLMLKETERRVHVPGLLSLLSFSLDMLIRIYHVVNSKDFWKCSWSVEVFLVCLTVVVFPLLFIIIIYYFHILLLLFAVGPFLIRLMQAQGQTSQEMNALNSNVSIHDAGQLMPLFFLWNSLESVERQSKLEPESVPITEPELGFPQHTNP